jgi:hypothetical protein
LLALAENLTRRRNQFSFAFVLHSIEDNWKIGVLASFFFFLTPCPFFQNDPFVHKHTHRESMYFHKRGFRRQTEAFKGIECGSMKEQRDKNSCAIIFHENSLVRQVFVAILKRLIQMRLSRKSVCLVVMLVMFAWLSSLIAALQTHVKGFNSHFHLNCL